MDCFGTYITHAQTCNVTRVQSATECNLWHTVLLSSWIHFIFDSESTFFPYEYFWPALSNFTDQWMNMWPVTLCIGMTTLHREQLRLYKNRCDEKNLHATRVSIGICKKSSFYYNESFVFCFYTSENFARFWVVLTRWNALVVVVKQWFL